jgi:hypothetical protein
MDNRGSHNTDILYYTEYVDGMCDMIAKDVLTQVEKVMCSEGVVHLV